MIVARDESSMGLIAHDFVVRLFPKPNEKHPQATVVALYGELGAGKTVFVKAIAKALGVAETVTSPTFVLEKMYRLTGKPFEHFIHIDAYRLEKPEELQQLGWDEILAEPKNLICVEWAENVEKLLPAVCDRVYISSRDEKTREIEFE